MVGDWNPGSLIPEIILLDPLLHISQYYRLWNNTVQLSDGLFIFLMKNLNEITHERLKRL